MAGWVNPTERLAPIVSVLPLRSASVLSSHHGPPAQERGSLEPDQDYRQARSPLALAGPLARPALVRVSGRTGVRRPFVYTGACHAAAPISARVRPGPTNAGSRPDRLAHSDHDARRPRLVSAVRIRHSNDGPPGTRPVPHGRDCFFTSAVHRSSASVAQRSSASAAHHSDGADPRRRGALGAPVQSGNRRHSPAAWHCSLRHRHCQHVSVQSGSGNAGARRRGADQCRHHQSRGHREQPAVGDRSARPETAAPGRGRGGAVAHRQRNCISRTEPGRPRRPRVRHAVISTSEGRGSPTRPCAWRRRMSSGCAC